MSPILMYSTYIPTSLLHHVYLLKCYNIINMYLNCPLTSFAVRMYSALLHLLAGMRVPLFIDTKNNEINKTDISFYICTILINLKIINYNYIVEYQYKTYWRTMKIDIQGNANCVHTWNTNWCQKDDDACHILQMYYDL